MAGPPELATQPGMVEIGSGRVSSRGSLDADIIIANAPDPVFVSDLEGKILQANDAVSNCSGSVRTRCWSSPSRTGASRARYRG